MGSNNDLMHNGAGYLDTTAYKAIMNVSRERKSGGKTTIGFLRTNDFFLLDGIKYRVGHLIDGTNGYIACVDVESKKVKRFYIDTTVEALEKGKEQI